MINSIKKTLSIVKKNKQKIFLLFFLQIIFLITLSMVFLSTIVPAMDHAKSAVDYYNKINISENPGMFDYLGDDPLVIYENYSKMMFYIKFMALFTVLVVLILNGLLWTLSDKLVNKKNLKESLNYFTKFGIILLIFIALFYILVFNGLKASLAKLEYSLLPLVGISVILIILLHFLFISLSIINKRKPKEILRLTFIIGIKKFPKMILIYLINLLTILLFSYLIYLTIEANMILLIISIILFVASFVLTRLLLIISINSLTKKN